MSDNRQTLTARITAAIERLSEERIEKLLKLSDDVLLALLQGPGTTASSDQLTAPTPVAVAHEAICIPFEIEGEEFEAVGYLQEGEGWIHGEEAIRRTDNGHLIRSNKDWWLLYQHRTQLPQELQRYWLVTARPNHPGSTRLESHLCFDNNVWYVFWGALDQGYRLNLMVRRRVVSPR